MDLGIKLKSLRLQCSLTQEELANRCDLTKGYISQLENNLTSPSIATLIDLLHALGTDLKSFFDDDIDDQVVFKEDDFFVKDNQDHSITWLVPNSQKNEMEPILLKLSPHSTSTADMPHEGEEFGYVLSNEAVLHIGKKTYNISKGDSFYFSASRVHFIENKSDEWTEILWVSSPPTF